MRDEALKRVEKLEEHIRISEAALEEQKKLRKELQSDVGSSKDRIQKIQHDLENISEQLGDAKVDKHEVSRTKKKTEIVENFKRLFPGVVCYFFLIITQTYCRLVSYLFLPVFNFFNQLDSSLYNMKS